MQLTDAKKLFISAVLWPLLFCWLAVLYGWEFYIVAGLPYLLHAYNIMVYCIIRSGPLWMQRPFYRMFKKAMLRL